MASTTAIDVGNFYLRSIQERVAKATAAQPPEVSKKEIDACYDEFKKDVSEHFQTGKFHWDSEARENFADCWSFDCYVTLEPGVVVKIDQDNLKPNHPWLEGRSFLLEKQKKHTVGCAKACVWRDLLETANINKFKAFMRAAISKPTREDCERLLKDWLALRGHVCPV